jgi:hypothetical protein
MGQAPRCPMGHNVRDPRHREGRVKTLAPSGERDRAGRFLAQNYIEIHQREASRYMSKIIRKTRSTQTAGNFI